jgi:hypothetical protein
MFRSITLAGLVLAGIFGVQRVEAAEPASPAGPSPMCREVSYKEYARKNHGPPGKYADVVVVMERTRLVCSDDALAKKPGRSAAVMRHHKSV